MKIRELCDLISKDTFIISDTHFGHENMLKFEPIRNRIQIEKNITIEKYMIDNWNDVVGENDTVFHLGDFGWREINVWATQLNGKKILLRGNHDRGKINTYQKAGFNVFKYAVIDIEDSFTVEKIEGPALDNCLIKEIIGKRIMFSHIPVFDNNEFDFKFHSSREYLQELFVQYNCSINIHGHVHSNIPKCSVCINVSVENIGFKPIKIKDLISNPHF